MNHLSYKNLPIYLIVIIFSLPFSVAVYFKKTYTPEHYNYINKGEFFSEAISLKDILDSNINNSWHILHTCKKQTEQACKEEALRLEKLHTALGKYSNKVRLISIQLENLEQSTQGSKILKNLYKEKYNKFILTKDKRLLLKYKTGIKLKDILHDLKKLLKNSRD